MQKSMLEVAYDTAKSLHEAGLLDATTMREFDALCLPEIKEFSPKKIKMMRLREKVSQPVFAKYLNISPSTVKHWEIGDKHPSGAALKLLNLVESGGLAAIV